MPFSAQSFAAAVAHVGPACASRRRGPGSRPRQSGHGDQSSEPRPRRRRRCRGCRSRLACVRHERTYSATSPSLPIRQPRRRTSGPVFRLGPPKVRPEAWRRAAPANPGPKRLRASGPGRIRGASARAAPRPCPWRYRRPQPTRNVAPSGAGPGSTARKGCHASSCRRKCRRLGRQPAPPPGPGRRPGPSPARHCRSPLDRRLLPPPGGGRRLTRIRRPANRPARGGARRCRSGLRAWSKLTTH